MHAAWPWHVSVERQGRLRSAKQRLDSTPLPGLLQSLFLAASDDILCAAPVQRCLRTGFIREHIPAAQKLPLLMNSARARLAIPAMPTKCVVFTLCSIYEGGRFNVAAFWGVGDRGKKSVPDRYSMTPPQLAGYAPIANVLQPHIVCLLEAFWQYPDGAIRYSLHSEHATQTLASTREPSGSMPRQDLQTITLSRSNGGPLLPGGMITRSQAVSSWRRMVESLRIHG